MKKILKYVVIVFILILLLLIISLPFVNDDTDQKNIKSFEMSVFNEYLGEDISYSKTVELLNIACDEYYMYLKNSEMETGNNPGIYLYLSENNSADKILKDSIVDSVKSYLEVLENSIEATYNITIGKNEKYGEYIIIKRNDLKMLRGEFEIISKTNDSNDNYDFIEDFKVILESKDFIEQINNQYSIDIKNNVKIWSMTKDNFIINIGCGDIDNVKYSEYSEYVFEVFKEMVEDKYNLKLEKSTIFNEIVQ